MTQALANKSLLPGLQGHVLTVHWAFDQGSRNEVFILIHIVNLYFMAMPSMTETGLHCLAGFLIINNAGSNHD